MGSCHVKILPGKNHSVEYHGGEQGRKPVVMGVGSLWEAGEERVGDGIPKGVGVGRKLGRHFCNTVQYFTVGKAPRGKNHYGKGWELIVHGTGSGKFSIDAFC